MAFNLNEAVAPTKVERDGHAVAVVSFSDDDRNRIVVHEFAGDYSLADGTRCWAGYRRSDLHGMSVGRFFDILLTHHYAACNKQVACVRLNTWYWVGVVGQNGALRGRPKLFRHRMPEPDDGAPFWVLRADVNFKGNRTRYVLVPLKEFTCRYCGEHFERYPKQYWHNICQGCSELAAEFADLAIELHEIGEDPVTSRVAEIIRQRMAEIDDELGWLE